jgi:hypothetical protein
VRKLGEEVLDITFICASMTRLKRVT